MLLDCFTSKGVLVSVEKLLHRRFVCRVCVCGHAVVVTKSYRCVVVKADGCGLIPSKFFRRMREFYFLNQRYGQQQSQQTF